VSQVNNSIQIYNPTPYYVHECGIRGDDNREASGRSVSAEQILLGTHAILTEIHTLNSIIHKLWNVPDKGSQWNLHYMNLKNNNLNISIFLDFEF